ncbi:MAG: hypothetical protein ACO2ZA_08145 [Litorivicinaceae bacterium]
MKKTISLLILVAALFGGTGVWAADCKYKWETANYRTGEKVLWTKWIMNRAFYTEDKPYGLVAGVAEGDKKYLGLQLRSPEVRLDHRPSKAEIDAAMVIPEGAKLSVLFGDGTIYDLFAERQVIGDTSFKAHANNKYSLESRAIVRFALDAAAFAALSGQKATDLRLHTPARNYDISFGKKPSDKIQKSLACIA